jgi:hypothetical protein
VTAEPDQQPMTRVVSVGAAPAVSPLMAGLLGALGPGYRAGEFGDADVVLVPATAAVTVEGAAAVARLRQGRPSVGIIAVTTGAPISPPEAAIALDAGADAVVRVQAPAELAAHVSSLARRISGSGRAATSAAAAGAARPVASAAGAGAARGVSSATAARPRRQHGKRTRIAAAIVSGGTALGLAGVMAAHAATQSPGSTTTVANPDSSGDGAVAPSPQSQAQSQDDSEGTSSIGSTGRFSGGATNAVPTQPHTRTRGS